MGLTMTTRRLVLGMLIAGPALTLPATGQAQSTLRIGTVVTAPHPAVTLMDDFKRQVEQRTGGAINVQLYPNSQLGGEREMAEALKLGSLEGSLNTATVFSTWVPIASVFDMPFVFRDDAHAWAVYSGAVGDRVAAAFPAQGFRVLGFTLAGVRNVFATVPINRPEDVRGRKMRTLQSPLHLQIWSSMGANPTPIPHPEVYNALQTKIVEIADNTATNYVNERWYEVAPHYSTTGHIYAISGLFLSERWYQRQKPEHQSVLKEATQVFARALHKAVVDGDAESLGKAAALGAKVIRIDDKSAWSTPMRPIWDAWIGNDAERRDLIQAITSTQSAALR
ncbi:MAG: TRAP transporter substrate-binding protein [Alphaproteobacteria bacterium]|nr:TRAP transporter substrate-binding protein [Alphaproteobacteria bacterium]